MKRFNPVKFIIMLAAILVTIRFVRYIPFAPIILIVIAISLVRNQRRQNRKTDEENRAEEQKCAEENRSGDSIITCDYCGSKVDTSKHAVCNHCGGPYWDDKEWKDIRNRKVS